MTTPAPTDDQSVPADDQATDETAGAVPSTIEPDADPVPTAADAPATGSADDGMATAPQDELDALQDFEETPAPEVADENMGQSMFEAPAEENIPGADEAPMGGAADDPSAEELPDEETPPTDDATV